MGNLTLPAGISILAYVGTSALPLTGSSKWAPFTATNFNSISKQSANRQGFISAPPTSQFPAFSNLDAYVAGSPPAAYIFSLKQPTVVDDTLFTVVGGGGTTNRIPFPTTDSLSTTDPLEFDGFSQIVDNMKSVLTNDAPSGVTVLYSLNGGVYQSLSATNDAIAALSASTIATNGYTLNRQITRTTNTAVDVTTTQTYAS